MIIGAVTADREAVVKLEVRGPAGTKAEVEFVLDTGFTEYLTKPFRPRDLLRMVERLLARD